MSGTSFAKCFELYLIRLILRQCTLTLNWVDSLMGNFVKSTLSQRNFELAFLFGVESDGGRDRLSQMAEETD